MRIGLRSWGCIVRTRRRLEPAALALALALVFAAGAVSTAQAQTYSVLHSFQCAPDGAYPQAGLVADKAGNLYGTTIDGGTLGDGAVFKLTPGGTETVYSFTNTGGPVFPRPGVVVDAEGNLYGGSDGGPNGDGVIYEVTPTGSETTLYYFTGGNDGNAPLGSLVRDSTGNLYGTTGFGGGWGDGVVFKLNPSGHEMVLHDFYLSETDGANPEDGLTQDAAGNLYGTTMAGGQNNGGIIFKVTLSGTETVLHSFLGFPFDGSRPSGGRLLRDAAGNLYGATFAGGASNQGAVFKLTPSGAETVLFSFAGGKSGFYPYDGLVEDKASNLYGATSEGGSAQCACGVLFKINAADQELVLHTFAGSPTDGSYPNGGLISDSAGNIYGTTSQGGTNGCGTVFKMTP
jgi:uncharacterized repeat protein (TIGR03803 family)